MPCRQRGVALVAVLMVIAIIVVIAVSMTGRLQLQLQRQQNVQQQQQAFWYAMGAEQFARVLLARALAGQETVNLSQDWALEGATFPVENGTIAGDIRDLRSCFNINALQNTAPDNGGRAEQSAAQKAFQRLLELKAGELTMPAEYLTSRIGDWLDEDSLLSGAGSAEEDDYASLLFPYYSANGLMASVSELRVILDMTPADYQLLLPFVCVVPEDGQLLLNVNTLTADTAVLLAALIPELTEQSAQEIIADRPEQGFGTVDELFALPALAGMTVEDDVKNMLTVKSDSFQLTATAAYLESGFILTSVLKINDNNQVSVLARRFGGQG
ncbi:type II secretion system minor pseudopilin GspK [Rheinheimera baltica]|uniref:Type II secretion system protein K n=1 Tax=Rheinheimera baltica TaxID=67576 RepID=A0ABT9HWE4_9GAMM|nr:type II secretion system minor pseudopilin GspK [Rheinheimera baltica]MDP5135150.1 type II secretion system minor pseudopilin GspK [Rheinheimera baltica]MDP5143567.1 type II secretion system minor pseudopilin GspK [Rheinheimera baltica]MDP5151078.1 type II secretion system minor pseudopilin GspK [Rheinheimera baltica]